MTTQLALSQGMAVKDTDRTADEWITLGETVHGGFGSHIALGIRIGQKALQRLGAKRSEVDVRVTESSNSPCACIADALMIATSASPGQKTLSVLPKSADTSYMTLIEIRNRTSGSTLTYRVPASALSSLAKMNLGTTAVQHLQAVFAMLASDLYEVASSK